jgi:ribulose-bisphosphate carboxylase large chain
LVSIGIPQRVLETFPGPAYGPLGLRQVAGFAPDEPAFGTILKPTAGITADEVAALVGEAAECPLLLFVKEDEDLYPNFSSLKFGKLL